MPRRFARRFLVAVVAGICSLPAASALGQMMQMPATAPATAPSTMPAVAADQTTPQGTLILFARSIQSGNATDLRQIFHAATPQDSKLADFFSERTKISANFREALAKKFGEDAATQLTNSSPEDVAIAEQHISAADVTIDGDKAKVQMKPEMPGMPAPEAMELVKADGKWKIPMSAMTEGMTQDKIDQSMKSLQAMSDVVAAVTEDVQAGKFTRVEEVVAALNARLEAAATALQTPAATQPTTAPGMP